MVKFGLVLLASITQVDAIEIDFKPPNDKEAQRIHQLEQSLKVKISNLATRRRLSAQQRDLVYKAALWKIVEPYRGSKGYQFNNLDIAGLEELVGTDARSKGTDLKGEHLEEVGLDRYLLATMNVMLTEMVEARAVELFGSKDAKFWRLSPDDMSRSSTKTFKVRHLY
jgi:hypothetical protein